MITLYLQKHLQRLQVAGHSGLVMGLEDVPQPRTAGGFWRPRVTVGTGPIPCHVHSFFILH